MGLKRERERIGCLLVIVLTFSPVHLCDALFSLDSSRRPFLSFLPVNFFVWSFDAKKCLKSIASGNFAVSEVNLLKGGSPFLFSCPAFPFKSIEQGESGSAPFSSPFCYLLSFPLAFLPFCLTVDCFFALFPFVILILWWLFPLRIVFLRF